MVRCGRLAVEGEEEVIAIFPKNSKPQQRHKKSSKNSYSSKGLDKFARLSDKLFAKGELFSNHTGTPEELVRFAYSSKGWVPVLFQNASHGGPGGVLVLTPIRVKEHKESKNIIDTNRGDENDVADGEINGFAKKEESVFVIMLPRWFGYLEITAFGVLCE